MSVNPGFALSSGGGTSAVYLDSTAGTLQVKLDPDSTLGGIRNTIAIYLHSTAGTIAADIGKTAGTITIRTDPGYELGSIKGINSSINTHIGSTGGTLGVRVGQVDGTVAVYFSPANPAVAATFSGSIAAVPQTGSGDPLYDEALNAIPVFQKSGQTFAVYFDPANPAVAATFSSASLEVVPTTGSRIMYDLGHQAVRALIVGTSAAASLQVTGITNSIAVHLLSTGGTLIVKNDPDSTIGAIRTALPAGTNDLGNIIRVKNLVDGTLSTVTSVTTVATLTSITNSIAVHLLSTAGTLNVRLADNSAGLATDDLALTPATDVGFPIMGFYDDTATDSVDEGDAGFLRMTANRLQMVHTDSTASIFTVSGSTSGGATSGVTLVSPSANYSFKVFAYSLVSTGLVSNVWRFTNGGESATEFWRGLSIPVSTTSETRGANGFIAPPGYLFATGTNTTLALRSDSGSLVHYSVSYIKESA